MSKQSNSSTALKQNPFTSDWTEHPLIEWVSANRQTILFGLLALFALIIISYRWIASRTLKAETDFFQAQVDFSHFQEKTLKPAEWSSSQEDLNRLDSLMTSHPELHAKYDGAIAQSLLIQNQPSQAKSYAEATFERTAQDEINPYHAYSQTSLLIGEGQFEQALQQTLQLKEKLDQAAIAKSDPLYLVNLIRMAMLYQQLNQPEQERQAWNELQQYSATLDALNVVNQIFKEGNASLQPYIEERKRDLLIP